jgi:hypothetical protein
MNSLDGIRSHRTSSFFVLGLKDDKVGKVSVVSSPAAKLPVDASSSCEQLSNSNSSPTMKSIFLDIDDPYTLNLIQKAFAHPSRAGRFCITLGSGEGMDFVELPAGCDFQWSEYERIDWTAVLAGKHAASSYCIRKGLSRKAQLAHYTHRHVCKNPDSILLQAMPKTVILDTWAVWEENGNGMANKEGLADVLVSLGSSKNDNVNQRKILDQCLVGAKQAMEQAEQTFEEKADAEAAAPVWILKGSTTNKGAGIFIVHLYEQVVDICWTECDIREWYVLSFVCLFVFVWHAFGATLLTIFCVSYFFTTGSCNAILQRLCYSTRESFTFAPMPWRWMPCACTYRRIVWHCVPGRGTERTRQQTSLRTLPTRRTKIWIPTLEKINAFSCGVQKMSPQFWCETEHAVVPPKQIREYSR